MTKETHANQVPAFEVIGTLTAAQDIVTIARMQAPMQGHDLDWSHPHGNNRPAKFRIVEIDENDGSARFANLDYAQQTKFPAAWANVTAPVTVGQVVTGSFSFDPAESLSRMEIPMFIFSKE